MGSASDGLLNQEQLQRAWLAYRDGMRAPCPCCDGGVLALCVEGTGAIYRMNCVRCGISSRWFQSSHRDEMEVFPAIVDEPPSSRLPGHEHSWYVPAI